VTFVVNVDGEIQRFGDDGDEPGFEFEI